MLSLNDILEEMPSLRDPSVYNDYKVGNVAKKLVPGTNQIQFTCTIKGSQGDKYKNSINVYDVDFQKNVEAIKDELDYWIEGETISGKKLYHSILTTENRVKLKCDCNIMN